MLASTENPAARSITVRNAKGTCTRRRFVQTAAIALGLALGDALAPSRIQSAWATEVAPQNLVIETSTGDSTRLTTPFYSILLDAADFPAGFTYRYRDEWLNEEDLCTLVLMGAYLEIYDAESGTDDPAFTVYCRATEDGSLSMADVRNCMVSQDVTWSRAMRSWTVGVACPVHEGDEEGAKSQAQRWSQTIVQVASAAGGSLGALNYIEGLSPYALEGLHLAYAIPESDETRIVTPGYEVLFSGEALAGAAELMYEENSTAQKDESGWSQRLDVSFAAGADTTHGALRASVFCCPRADEPSPGALDTGITNPSGTPVFVEVECAAGCSGSEVTAAVSWLAGLVSPSTAVSTEAVKRALAMAEPPARLPDPGVTATNETGGTRITTQYYTAIIPARLVDEEFALSYSQGPLASAAASGKGFATHQVTVDCAGDGPSDERGQILIRCRGELEPIGDGPYASVIAGTRSTDGLLVEICVLYDAWSTDAEGLHEKAAALAGEIATTVE